MGAASFIMAETLGIPYAHLVLIAIIPAAAHYFAILLMVHLESKRLKLVGMDTSEIPSAWKVLASSWHLFIPLIVMVTLLLMQYTPFLAAFWGIILCVVCSWIPKLMGKYGRNMAGMAIGPRALLVGMEMGAKSALGYRCGLRLCGVCAGYFDINGYGF